MTDYATISKAEIEAAINKFEGTDGWAARLADEIRAILDKAPSVEPFCWAVDCKPEYADLYNFDERNVIVSDEITLREYQEDDSWVITPLYPSPPQAEPSVEPVGYVVSTKPELLWGGNDSSIIFREYDGHLRPLYTSPPQAEARIAELEKDVRRYRFMRNNISVLIFEYAKFLNSHRLDNVVDELMEKTNAK